MKQKRIALIALTLFMTPVPLQAKPTISDSFLRGCLYGGIIGVCSQASLDIFKRWRDENPLATLLPFIVTGTGSVVLQQQIQQWGVRGFSLDSMKTPALFGGLCGLVAWLGWRAAMDKLDELRRHYYIRIIISTILLGGLWNVRYEQT